MQKIVKDIVGVMNTPAVLNTRFIQIIDSLSGIRKLSYLGNQQLSRDTLIDSMLSAVIEHLGAERVALYLLEDNVLNCVACLTWEKYAANESGLENDCKSYLLDESTIGKTASSREVIHIRNCKLSDNNVINYEGNGHIEGSLICAPIMVNDAVHGVLELSHPNPDHFESWQEHSIIIYADLIGMLLHNNTSISNIQNIVDVRTQELSLALEESEKLRARYEEMSVIDPLTKLYNRRYFFSEVAAGLARAKRYDHPFSLMLMDLDFFKEVNDNYGHECGDKVLKNVSDILNRFTREGDTLARYGGEEFVMALPETDYDGAKILAERIRTTIEENEWECIDKNITISIGISSLNQRTENQIDEDVQIADIIREADRALYYVKQNGRNNVKAFSDIP